MLTQPTRHIDHSPSPLTLSPDHAKVVRYGDKSETEMAEVIIY